MEGHTDHLTSKLVPPDEEFRNSAYPIILDQDISDQYWDHLRRTIILDIIWPHWFSHPKSDGHHVTDHNWKLVSDYSRGLEYVEEILPEIVSHHNPPAVSLLEAGLAGACSANLTTATVLCISAHGALVVYKYQDCKPTCDPIIYNLESWRHLVKKKVRKFIVDTAPHVIMCDVDYYADSEELLTRGYPSIQLFAIFVNEKVLPVWNQEFQSVGIKKPVFVRQREMMMGAEAFSQLHLLKSFVHVSKDLGGLFAEHEPKDFYSSDKRRVCAEYTLQEKCSRGWRCTRSHVSGCPELKKDGFCPRDPLVCPWMHLTLADDELTDEEYFTKFGITTNKSL